MIIWNVFIIYVAEEAQHVAAYEKVVADTKLLLTLDTPSCQLNWNFLRQSSSSEYETFDKLLLKSLGVDFDEKQEQLQVVELRNQYVQFLVDDMLFYRDVNILEAFSILDSDSKILGYEVVLHPGITYCHPANSEMTAPFLMENVGIESKKFLRSFGTHDWNYP